MENQPHAYSVWAIPPEDVTIRLNKLMNTLRSEFGGPELVPHITVVRAVTLTPEDALEKFRLACKGLKAYNVQASGVSTGTCPYLLFDATPEVVGTSDHCCGYLDTTAPPAHLAAYKPHMSLLYADLTDEDKKKAEERAVILDENIANLSFTIDRLALYLTDEDKTLKSWKKISECELQAI